jgi:RNA polymerase sigma-70 factor (ECF subfamily)
MHFRLIFVRVEASAKNLLPEDELVSRLFQRDQDAFSYLYDHYSSAVYGVIFRILQDEESAQDVLQEAFLKIWNNFQQYDKTKGRLFTWIVNLSRNLAIDATRSKTYKNKQKNLGLDNVVSFIDSNKNTALNPDQIGLKAIVEKLRPEQREIIDLAYFKGYTQVEISETMNIPLGTVKTRMRSAILRLREII